MARKGAEFIFVREIRVFKVEEAGKSEKGKEKEKGSFKRHTSTVLKNRRHM